MYPHRWFSFLKILRRDVLLFWASFVRASYPVFGAPQTYLPNQCADYRVTLTVTTVFWRAGEACVEPRRGAALPFPSQRQHSSVHILRTYPYHGERTSVWGWWMLRHSMIWVALVPSLWRMGRLGFVRWGRLSPRCNGQYPHSNPF
jgi:hypothetical protein